MSSLPQDPEQPREIRDPLVDLADGLRQVGPALPEHHYRLSARRRFGAALESRALGAERAYLAVQGERAAPDGDPDRLVRMLPQETAAWLQSLAQIEESLQRAGAATPSSAYRKRARQRFDIAVAQRRRRSGLVALSPLALVPEIKVAHAAPASWHWAGAIAASLAAVGIATAAAAAIHVTTQRPVASGSVPQVTTVTSHFRTLPPSPAIPSGQVAIVLPTPASGPAQGSAPAGGGLVSATTNPAPSAAPPAAHTAPSIAPGPVLPAPSLPSAPPPPPGPVVPVAPPGAAPPISAPTAPPTSAPSAARPAPATPPSAAPPISTPTTPPTATPPPAVGPPAPAAPTAPVAPVVATKPSGSGGSGGGGIVVVRRH